MNDLDLVIFCKDNNQCVKDNLMSSIKSHLNVSLKMVAEVEKYF